MEVSNLESSTLNPCVILPPLGTVSSFKQGAGQSLNVHGAQKSSWHLVATRWVFADSVKGEETGEEIRGGPCLGPQCDSWGLPIKCDLP